MVRQFTIKLFVFLALVYVLLTLLDIYYTRYTLAHKNVCEKSDWILAHSGQSYDFAFIGNSRVINMADINALEEKTGKQGINLGLIGAGYAENYLVLDQFLKSGNKIKNLFVQVDMHSLNSTKELGYPFHNYNYMHLLSDTTVYHTFRDNNPAYKTLMWKYVPFTRYMEFSNRYVLYKMLKGGFECRTSADFDASKGATLIDGPFDPKKHVAVYSYWTGNKRDAYYLERLTALAKSHCMNIVFYSAPMYDQYRHYQLGYDAMLGTAKQFAASQGIRFIDFSRRANPLCRDLANFNDNIHMNREGVAKFSSCLADSIKPLLN